MHIGTIVMLSVLSVCPKVGGVGWLERRSWPADFPYPALD